MHSSSRALNSNVKTKTVKVNSVKAELYVIERKQKGDLAAAGLIRGCNDWAFTFSKGHLVSPGLPPSPPQQSHLWLLKNKQVLPVQAQPWDFLGNRSAEPCEKGLWVKTLTEFQMLQVCEAALLCSLFSGRSLLFMGQRAA